MSESLISEGALDNKHFPSLDFGKAITSRILWVLQMIDIYLSTPVIEK